MIGRFSIALLGAAALVAAPKNEPVERISEAAKVFQEIQGAADKGVPQDILDKAKCIAIVPGLKKAGFVVGGEYGKGELVCRTSRGLSGPSTIRVEGGSFGLQIGGGETDLILVVMNDEGVHSLMKSDFKIGGAADAMAGPVGRSAEADTDALMRAKMLSYSRSRGAFAGLTLKGTTLRQDKDDNRAIYGKDVEQEDIIMGKVSPPAAAQPLLSTLRKYFRANPPDAKPLKTKRSS